MRASSDPLYAGMNSGSVVNGVPKPIAEVRMFESERPYPGVFHDGSASFETCGGVKSVKGPRTASGPRESKEEDAMGESRSARPRCSGFAIAHPAKTRDGCAALRIAFAGDGAVIWAMEGHRT